MEIVDGYSVESDNDGITLTLSNRYGELQALRLSKDDAKAIVEALQLHLGG
jgi:hypothetical protein